VVDQLASEYANQPVVFLEQDVDHTLGNRYGRWWAAYDGGGSVMLPLVMVDSGHQISNGPVDYYNTYKAMVEAELVRLAQAEIEAQSQRIGDTLHFDIQLTNLSGVTLSGSSNSATVHAIVYEDAHVGVTDRIVRAAVSTSIFPALAHGETMTFTLETELSGVDWDKIHSFARYLPTGNLEEFIEHYGGCHLWRTKDGERFYPVMRNGFGTPYNIGIRQMRSTLVGLFVGTANPFGPLVGVKKNGKWVYEPNPRGGTEIWLGSPPMKVQKVQSSISGAKDKQYRRALLKVGRKLERLPFYIMTDDFYDNAGFHHVGYWRENTTNGREACEAIIDKLMTLDIQAQGQTLDVACGKGGTTRYLLNYFPAGQLIGIDELQWAVDCCRENIPTVRFLTMDPARLEFPDETFMNIICVEEAPYFTTRYDFLKESVRVLKPGGRLVLADILFSRDAVKANRGRYRTNYVKDLNSYRKLLSRAGFEANPEIMDLTGYTILPYTESLSEYMTDGAFCHSLYSCFGHKKTGLVLFLDVDADY